MAVSRARSSPEEIEIISADDLTWTAVGSNLETGNLRRLLWQQHLLDIPRQIEFVFKLPALLRRKMIDSDASSVIDLQKHRFDLTTADCAFAEPSRVGL